MSVIFPSTVGLEFDWGYPDVPRINYQLLQIEEYLGNTQAFTEMAKEEAQIDMATRFETETDPDGIPWLSLAQPAPEQIGILQLTGQMREDAISEEAWTATPVGLFFNTAALPDYWIYHEQPEGVGSQRITQRRFIGLDADTERKLENRADEWLANGLMLGTRGFVRQVRSPLGRFAPLP